MEPTLKTGERILSTNLKSPKRNDIIIYSMKVNERYEPDPLGKEYEFCKRLIAVGGDTIEIKNGYAYTNGHLADDTTKLKFGYSLDARQLENLMALLETDPEKNKYSGQFTQVSDTLGIAFLSYKEYEQAKNTIRLRRNLNELNSISKIYPQNWTIDNFGPYVIPSDHYFVMGDRRHNSQDSRYTGPIPVKDLKGVVIGKH